MIKHLLNFFFAFKKYNSDNITLHSFNVNTLQPGTVIRQLTVNASAPVFAFDQNKKVLYMATANHDHIYQLDPMNIANDFGLAVLPWSLRQVSSMLIVDDFLYFVTWEPNAFLARIQISGRFCKLFCGTYGYCADSKANLCLCAPGYKNPESNTNGPIQCLPSREVDIYLNVINERGLAIAFGILFFVALIAAAGGWAMWWRGRKSVYSSLGR